METKNITLKFNEEETRARVNLSSKTLEKWERFVEKYPKQKGILMTAALENFMNAYKNGEIKILIEL